MLDPKLLEILVCPNCKGELRVAEERQALICDQCQLLYPVRDGIPILLIDDAEPSGSN